LRLLLYKWGGFNEVILERKLIETGHEIVPLEQKCNDYNSDMNLAMKIMELVRENSLEGVVSFNFFPIVAVTCNAVGVLYYSWIYDSPHTTLFSEAVKYDTNRVGIFDRALVDELRKKRVTTVKHVPLAVDTKTLTQRIKNTRSGKLSENQLNNIDISFVGSLYTDKNNYYDLYKEKADNNNSWDELDNLIEKQTFDYKDSYINSQMQDYGLIEKSLKSDGIDFGPDYFITMRDVAIQNVLERKVTIEERRILLTQIVEEYADKYRINIYTSSNTDNYPKIDKVNCGIVGYDTLMPGVFNKSAVNMNITLRSIRTGIPLRALDIMGCGGLLMSNYQEELDEYFTDGESLVLFSGLEDCLEKINFYLEHDEAREMIARKGFETVEKNFTYERMLSELIK